MTDIRILQAEKALLEARLAAVGTMDATLRSAIVAAQHALTSIKLTVQIEDKQREIDEAQ